MLLAVGERVKYKSYQIPECRHLKQYDLCSFLWRLAFHDIKLVRYVTLITTMKNVIVLFTYFSNHSVIYLITR